MNSIFCYITGNNHHHLNPALHPHHAAMSHWYHNGGSVHHHQGFVSAGPPPPAPPPSAASYHHHMSSLSAAAGLGLAASNGMVSIIENIYTTITWNKICNVRKFSFHTKIIMLLKSLVLLLYFVVEFNQLT